LILIYGIDVPSWPDKIGQRQRKRARPGADVGPQATRSSYTTSQQINMIRMVHKSSSRLPRNRLPIPEKTT
jgi:hypothetical protein